MTRGAAELDAIALLDAALELDPVAREALLDDPAHAPAAVALVRQWLAADATRDPRLSPAHYAALAQAGARAESTAGDRVGAWTLVREIGRGGMGSVWLAERSEGDFAQRAALKLIRADLTATDAESRFRRERRILATLQHPHVAQLLDGGVTPDGRPWLAMEWVEGQTLREAIAATPLEPQRLLVLASEVAAALAHAHEAGVVHRDLKPENVMLARAGYAKVLDFGIAKLLVDDATATGTQTQPGRVIGTMPYMSPEQASGGAVDFRSDQFALGAVLYEAATGRAAFARDTPAETIAAVLRDTPPMGTSVGVALPPGFLRVIERCLSKDPAGRYASTQDLAREFAELARGVDAGRHRATRRGRGVAAALIVVGLGVALALLFADRRAPLRESPPRHADAAAPTAIAPATAPAASSLASIAVLPFANLSEDKANEHFGDGLAEDLLNLLAKTPGLKVAARTSSFHFKGKPASVAEIAEALGVATVLEGSVRREGGTVRVVVQLIAADDGSHLWSEKYDRKLEDIFLVQDEIAGSIVEGLLPRLGLRAAAPPRARVDPVVYERFLRARGTFYGGTLESHQRLKDEFAAIAEQAPDFPAVHGWLARVWLNIDESTGGLVPVSVSHPAAQAAIDRALALDPSEASAYHALGLLRGYQGRRDEALAAYARAVELNPAMVDSLINRSDVLQAVGRAEEAREALDQAHLVDPLHPRVLVSRVRMLAAEGKLRAAFAALDHALPANPASAKMTEVQALYFANHQTARAIFLLESLLQDDTLDRWVLDPFVAANQQLGLHDEPLIAKSAWRALSLAVRGNAVDAERVLIELRAGKGLDVPWIETRVRIAQARFDEAEAVLVRAQAELGEYDTGRPYRALTIAMLAARRHDDARVATLLAEVERLRADGRYVSLGPLDANEAYLALLHGRTDEALRRFTALADAGYPGDASSGGTVMAPWLFERDPRFAPILARYATNASAQRATLARLRRFGMTPAQARAEHVATLPADPP